MMIQSTHKARTYKDAVVLDTANETDTAIIAAAKVALGETTDSLFGWSVRRYDGGSTAVVSLYTD